MLTEERNRTDTRRSRRLRLCKKGGKEEKEGIENKGGKGKLNI